MIPVALNLKDKKVLIIGGGHVAYRKVKLFLKEKAIVYVLSEEISDEIKQKEVNCIVKKYEKDDIKDYFLVYAATNDKEVNHKIVLDCNKLSILCGSATYDEHVSLYSMGYIEHDKALIALSMKQRLPYHKPLLEKMNKILDDNDIRLDLLMDIREAVLKYSHNTKDYYKRLFDIDINILFFIKEAYMNKKGYLFVYHQSEYKQQYLFDKEPSLCLSIVEYEKYRDILNIYDYIEVVPLVLCDGFILDRIKELSIPLKCHKPLINKLEDLDTLLDLLDDYDHSLYFIHPRGNSLFKNRLIKSKDCHCVLELGEKIDVDKNTEYHIIPLLMTRGKHYYDLLNEVIRLNNEGYKLILEDCLLKNSKVILLIEDRV